MIVTSFLKESTPGIFTSEFTLINYQTIFSKNPRVHSQYLSCYGLIAIALVIVFGVLIAYLAVRQAAPCITSTVDTLTMLPYIIPGSVLGICAAVRLCQAAAGADGYGRDHHHCADHPTDALYHPFQYGHHQSDQPVH